MTLEAGEHITHDLSAQVFNNERLREELSCLAQESQFLLNSSEAQKTSILSSTLQQTSFSPLTKGKRKMWSGWYVLDT